jgi:lycopene beta-cyclase
MESYEYIFAGAGCAGLSLVYYMLESKQLKDSKILMIDPLSGNIPNKTWCYWSENPLAIHPVESKIFKWDNLEFKSGERTLKKHLGNLYYFHLNSLEFFNSILNKIQRYSNVTILKDSVTEIKSSEDKVILVTTNNGKFIGDFVFDSRLNPIGNFYNKQMNQLFSGWTIESETELFDPETITMMDFAGEGKNNFDFFYLLPFSKNKALVEFTVYSVDPITEESLETELRKYLSKLTNNQDYKIVFRETGIIPMSTQVNPNLHSDRIIPIGTNGGWTKASTGYTFHTIQKNCTQLVAKLESGNFKGLKIRKSSRFKFYDNILLNIVHKWPERLQDLFFNLFETSKAETVLRFLNEDTGFGEELKMLSKLRFKIFIKSLLKYESH